MNVNISTRELKLCYYCHKDFVDTPVNKIPSATPEVAYKLLP